jgi:type II secretory pathway pseudopilin PulG
VTKLVVWHNKKIKGFILIETIIAICVIGVLSSIIIPNVKMFVSSSKILRTNQSMDFVIKSLSVYAKTHNRLPLPEVGSSGLENDINQFVGTIPHKTLCIEEQMKRDGHHRNILYVVNPILTAWIPKTPFDETEIAFTKIQGQNNMHVIDDGSPALFFDEENATAADFCAIALISITPTSTYSIDDIVTYDGSNIQISIPQRSSGVIVRWISRNNLFVLCGKF